MSENEILAVIAISAILTLRLYLVDPRKYRLKGGESNGHEDKENSSQENEKKEVLITHSKDEGN